MLIKINSTMFNSKQQIFTEIMSINKVLITKSVKDIKSIIVYYENNELRISYIEFKNEEISNKLEISRFGHIDIKFLNNVLLHLVMSSIYYEITLEFSLTSNQLKDLFIKELFNIPFMSSDTSLNPAVVVREGYPVNKLKFIKYLHKGIEKIKTSCIT